MMIAERNVQQQGNGNAAARIRNSAYTINPYGRNKLCALENFTSDIPLRYRVTVFDKNGNADLVYESDSYSLSPAVPVIGLYALYTTNVTIELIEESGNVTTNTIRYEPRADYDDFSDHILQVQFEVTDPAMGDATINNGWLFNGYYGDAFDKNGDIRACGLCEIQQANIPMKFHRNTFVVPRNPLGGLYYVGQYDKLTIMGEVVGNYFAPEGYGFHHDLTWDDDGNVYLLTSRLDGIDADHFWESHILKLREDTGEMVAFVDYSSLYHDFDTIVYSNPYDTHLNSIEYVSSLGQLLLNSRNSSCYYGIDKTTLMPAWVVQNPQHKQLLPEMYNLRVLNPQQFVYPNGEHTIFETRNPAYNAYRGAGKLVLTLFDNVACKDENGNDILVPTGEAVNADIGYPFDSAMQVVAIDLNSHTIEQISRFTIPGVRSNITSNVFDTDNAAYFQVYYGVPTDYFVIDPSGSVGVSGRHMRPELDFPVVYRGRVQSKEAIIAMLGE